MQAPLASRRYEPYCMLLVERVLEGADGDAEAVEDGVVLAYLVVLTKEIEHAGHTFRAAGLSGVSTRPDRRGEGHAARLVRAAFDHIAARASRHEVDLSVFTCDEPLARLYEAAPGPASRSVDDSVGWERMPHTVVVGGTREQPFRADSLHTPEGAPKVTMMRFFSDAARAHRPAFEGTPAVPVDVYLDLREGDLW